MRLEMWRDTQRIYDPVLSRGRARGGLTSSLDSRDSPALKLPRDQQVHVRIGTGRVASREEMGLPRQKNGDEVAQSHGDAPGLVADPDELADPITSLIVWFVVFVGFRLRV